MGGQNETVLPKKGDTTDLGQGLRVHSSGGYVHFHDDDEKGKGKEKIKSAVPSAVFWKAWNAIRSGQESQFRYVDSQNDSILLIKMTLSQKDVTVALNATEPFGDTYRALDKFANA